MRLTYEQMRQLAQLGPANDRIIVKNKKGQILKPPLHKCHQNQVGVTQFTSMAERPKPSHVLTGSPFHQLHSATCYARPQRAAKR